jgi:hypothetical protein
MELAWELREGRRPSGRLVARTVSWVWPEMEDSLKAAVVQARMRELPGAEDALHDLDARAWRSPIVRVVVERLARRLAAEMV